MSEAAIAAAPWYGMLLTMMFLCAARERGEVSGARHVAVGRDSRGVPDERPRPEVEGGGVVLRRLLSHGLVVRRLGLHEPKGLRRGAISQGEHGCQCCLCIVEGASTGACLGRGRGASSKEMVGLLSIVQRQWSIEPLSTAGARAAPAARRARTMDVSRPLELPNQVSRSFFFFSVFLRFSSSCLLQKEMV